MQRLLIVAGELSGDMHGAMLAQALKQEDDSLSILGVGGRYMKEAGIDIVHGIEDLDVVGTPIHLSETPAGPHTCAPELGQHTEEILLDIGYSWEDIESLKNTGVI